FHLSMLLPRSDFFFFCLIWPAPTSTLFPYTTLFRSFLLNLYLPTFAKSYLLGSKNNAFNKEDALSTVGGSPGLNFLYISIRPSSDRKSTRLNSSHVKISYAVFCLKKKTHDNIKRSPM